ncbi:hypothetical protein RQP46_010480 [Phenoliferia psychrophenolica]
MLTRSTILSLLAGLAAAAPSVVIEASATVAQPQQQHGGLEAEAGRLILVGGYSRFTEVLRFNPFVEPATLERVSSSDGGDSILLSVNDNGAPGAAGYVASFLLSPSSGAISFVDHKITQASDSSESGVDPAHAAFFPDGKTVGVANSAEVHVSNDGRFLYASTRNLTSPAFIPPGDAADILAVWSINSTTGHLTRQQSAMAFGGRGLRAMELSPALTGSSGGGEDYVVTGGQTTNTTQVFKRDRTDGTLELVASCGNRFSPSTYIWV